MPKFFRSITKPFHVIPIAGIILRETARVADQVTAPAQSVTKKVVNEVTGARKRENKRLDEQKAQLILEAQQRVVENLQANQQNITVVMTAEANSVRAAIENAERELASDTDLTINQDEIAVPNPFFAYEDCRLGRTQELGLVLRLNDTNDTYTFFMKLNPLNEAYLSYIESNIAIDALIMLSEHAHPSINASKLDLLSNILSSIDDEINIGNFAKIKKIMLAAIQLEGDTFLTRVREYVQIHQPLINVGILLNDSGVIFGQLDERALAAIDSPRPSP